jgi:hypothetical protein
MYKKQTEYILLTLFYIICRFDFSRYFSFVFLYTFFWLYKYHKYIFRCIAKVIYLKKRRNDKNYETEGVLNKFYIEIHYNV